MGEPIAKGDLVMIVRGHACITAMVGGIPFRVTEIIAQKGGGWRCEHCHRYNIAPDDKFAARWEERGNAPLSWLIRIDPPALTEDAHLQAEKERSV